MGGHVGRIRRIQSRRPHPGTPAAMCFNIGLIMVIGGIIGAFLVSESDKLVAMLLASFWASHCCSHHSSCHPTTTPTYPNHPH